MSLPLAAFTPAASLNAEQRQNLATLIRVYGQYGTTPALTLAAAANAWAESRLRNDAVAYTKWPDGRTREFSVGLHQLKVPDGAGSILNPPGPVFREGRAYAHPADPRLDPVTNVRALIEQELDAGRWADTVKTAGESDMSVLDLALLFGRRIERHAWNAAHIRIRTAAYTSFLGAWAARESSEVNNATEAAAIAAAGSLAHDKGSSAAGGRPMLSLANAKRLRVGGKAALMVVLLIVAIYTALRLAAAPE